MCTNDVAMMYGRNSRKFYNSDFTQKWRDCHMTERGVDEKFNKYDKQVTFHQSSTLPQHKIWTFLPANDCS